MNYSFIPAKLVSVFLKKTFVICYSIKSFYLSASSILNKHSMTPQLHPSLNFASIKLCCSSLLTNLCSVLI